MTVRMGLIRKKPTWSSASFDAHWHHEHGALARQAPGLRAYWQNPVTDRLQRGIDHRRGPWDVDGFSQLWFDNAAQSAQAFGEGHLAAALRADEQHFLESVQIVTAEQHVVVAPPAPPARARLLKRMSLLKRRSDISEAEFRREWVRHGELVRQMPGVGGYRQNVVIARERVKGEPCGYEALPIDGIVELWFADTQTLEAAFASPAGRTTMAHAQTFLDEITAFVVAERRII